MTDKKKTVDLRVVLLEMAAECFSNRHVTGLNGKEYWGEDAIHYGYDLISLTQHLERKLHIN